MYCRRRVCNVVLELSITSIWLFSIINPDNFILSIHYDIFLYCNPTKKEHLAYVLDDTLSENIFLNDDKYSPFSFPWKRDHWTWHLGTVALHMSHDIPISTTLSKSSVIIISRISSFSSNFLENGKSTDRLLLPQHYETYVYLD